jgi:death on curing protein
LLSALARPQHLATCGDPDVADLAASYAVDVARNHPFLDGNERTALVTGAGIFLPLNGFQLTATDVEVVKIMLLVAEGAMPELEFAAWLRANIQPSAPQK